MWCFFLRSSTCGHLPYGSTFPCFIRLTKYDSHVELSGSCLLLQHQIHIRTLARYFVIPIARISWIEIRFKISIIAKDHVKVYDSMWNHCTNLHVWLQNTRRLLITEVLSRLSLAKYSTYTMMMRWRVCWFPEAAASDLWVQQKSNSYFASSS